MLSILRRRLATGIATTRYPAVSEPPPDAFRGMPALVDTNCRGDGACADVCPTVAIRVTPDTDAPPPAGGWTWRLDRAACTGCGLCIEACPHAALLVSPAFELASRTRADLIETVHFKAQSEVATP
jgi:formate hydrogenlyase subunit 6/NADH:ubiquinone oxidoreductase subunit I